ncbi:methyltransf_25 domain-containing protein [Trichonephila clavata]|uniref:Methyltransf_25 domain-containing protein n=1 Tax=Trichonephila clavata TaxID=2740835 RepID=A0A8X6K3K2_TRICU|nr:methyltransf_25 domain-containing protein [Trichonephila clavata]
MYLDSDLYKRVYPIDSVIHFLSVTLKELVSATERWRGQISHLISVNCFHFFKDQEKSLRLVYDVLQPGGKAACYFVWSSDYYDTVIQMENHPKWKSLLEEVDLCIPESYHKKYDSSHYQKLVENIGFKVVLCRSEFKINRLPSHEAAKDLLYSICSVIPHIPEEQRHIFKDEFYRSLLDNGARDNNGAPLHRALTLEIVIQKPDFASD